VKIALLALALAGCANESQQWTYERPAAWRDQCASGRHQSPIDLRGAARESKPLELQWQPASLVGKHTGHTVQFEVGAGSHIGDRTLKQFHYHVPSEHTVDGRHAALEFHFVHTDDSGRPALVVAVLVNPGKSDPANATGYGRMARALPAHEGETLEYQNIDLTQLLPAKLARYEYDGSLTTPPCSEGVHWIVMAEPVALDPAMVEAFSSVPHLKGSARPTQPLHDRRVTISR
jgi:carbonic anhydrase